MPEYPDITVYIEALRQRIMSATLTGIQLNNPFLLRTASPVIDEFIGGKVIEISRMGKRVVLELARANPVAPKKSHLWMVFHLMIAGRLHWKPPTQKPPGRSALITLCFETGYLYLTEAGSKRRAALHLFDDKNALIALDPGGLEVLETDVDNFARVFTAANHTLKRALTDPHILSGIGNAYSDEILHKAKLSPVKMTQKLSNEELHRLFKAINDSLCYWADNLRKHYGDTFPEKVTAFRDDMAVHGRYGKPCPECGAPVQRIVYSSNETNYCPTCQTEGRILADRALSQLLKKDWPRTLEDMEKRYAK